MHPSQFQGGTVKAPGLWAAHQPNLGSLSTAGLRPKRCTPYYLNVQSAFTTLLQLAQSTAQAEIAGLGCTGKNADREDGCKGCSVLSAADAAKSALSFSMSVKRADA